jgi:hypothetical protein
MSQFTVTIRSEYISHKLVSDFAQKYHGVLGNGKSANWFVFENYEDAQCFSGALSSYLGDCEPEPPQGVFDSGKCLKDLEESAKDNAK